MPPTFSFYPSYKTTQILISTSTTATPKTPKPSSAAARRAATSTLPLLRASASGATRSAAIHHPLSAAAARPQPRSMPLSSGPSTKPGSDGELLRIIDSEIKYAEESDDHDRVPDNWPFKISDEKGSNAITLTRTYQGEKIEILVSMPSDEPENEADKDRYEKRWTNDLSDLDQEEETQKSSKSSIPLTVTISKGDGTNLEFTCTAYPDEITLSMMQPSEDDEDEMITHEGPDFNDLDENLRRAFPKYLELRGITPMATNFLHEYMINKDNREYLLWLRKLKDFVRH